jgi:hypothetical protein
MRKETGEIIVISPYGNEQCESSVGKLNPEEGKMLILHTTRCGCCRVITTGRCYPLK